MSTVRSVVKTVGENPKTSAASGGEITSVQAVVEKVADQFDFSVEDYLALAERAIARMTDKAISAETMMNLLTLKGAVHMLKIVGRVGSLIRIQEVTALTGLSTSGIHKAKSENRLLAFRLPGKNFDLFPIFQFDKGSVRPWIPELLGLVGNGMAAIDFLAARRNSQGGKSFIENLTSFDFPVPQVAQLLERAKRIGEAGA